MHASLSSIDTRRAARLAATLIAAAMPIGTIAASVASAPGAHATTLSAEVRPLRASYHLVTLDDRADPTFNQLLGVNDYGTIAGYFGSGADPAHPNKGYTLTPPYGQASYHNENFPGSVQTQVTGINDRGTTVGFWVDGNGTNIGFTERGGSFVAVHSGLSTAAPAFDQLLGVNNEGQAVGIFNAADGTSGAFRYDLNTRSVHQIHVPGATSAAATGINDRGDISGPAPSGAGPRRT